MRSTSEAKERRPLSDSDEEVEGSARFSPESVPRPPRSPFEDPEEDSSEEDELVEMRPRRTS